MVQKRALKTGDGSHVGDKQLNLSFPKDSEGKDILVWGCEDNDFRPEDKELILVH